MFYPSFLRICNDTKSTIKHRSRPVYIHRVSAVFSSLWLTASVACGLLLSTPVWAESNVAGEEIIIFSDDSFKPARRDLSDRDAAGKEPSLRNPATSIVNKVPGKSSIDNNPAQTADIEHGDLWQRIKSGYAIPDSNSELIARHESWYSSRPDYMKRMVERSQKYLFHIVEEVEKRGMPTEIALLPMIESAYNPQAYSSGRASGIWQFIPSTGKHFGLKQNWWVDNRRNVTFATDAALTYLQKLHAMFGAWDLALAAYNAGEGTVGRAIERNRKLGLATDYESLNLPPETRNYVPKLQAIKNLMTNPSNYGLEIQTIANTPYFARVSAPAQIDAHLAAKLAEISDHEFVALNPGYNRPVIMSNSESHELLLPISSAQTFRSNLASFDSPLVSWKTYFAKRGERVDSIAAKFGIGLDKLRDINDLPMLNKIKNSATILVPNGKRADFNPSASPLTKATQHTPAFEPSNDVSIEQTSANIDLNRAEIKAETSRDAIEPVKQNSLTHKVKKGEALITIAKQYGISVKQISASNSLKNNSIKAGQILTINSALSTKSNDKSAARTKIAAKSQSYTIKRGDTLDGIAQKFSIEVSDIKRWNQNISHKIQPGKKLTIKPASAS
jgi:membrane-bound lytic murein transglycosylase D